MMLYDTCNNGGRGFAADLCTLSVVTEMQSVQISEQFNMVQ